MRRTILVAAAAAAVLALAVFAILAPDGRRPAPVPPSAAAPGVTDHAFHRSPALASTAARVRAAEARLNRITSAEPTVLGALKDEIALLADREEVIDLLVSDCARRFPITRFEAAAFMDLFIRIRHPRLVPFVAAGLAHADGLVRANAIDAAMTQRHGDLLPPLRALLDESEGYLRARVIEALDAIGTADSRTAFIPLVLDPSPEVALAAIAFLGRARCIGAASVLRRALDHEDPLRRVAAAHALVLLGDPEAPDRLVAALRTGPDAARVRAARHIGDLDLGTAPELRDALGEAPGPLGREILRALALRSDPETLRSLLADLGGGDENRRRTAAWVLGSSLPDGAATRLETALDGFEGTVLIALAHALSDAGGPEALALLGRLARRAEPGVASRAIRGFHDFGEAGLRAAVELFPNASPDLAPEILASIASHKTAEAGDALLALRGAAGKDLAALIDQGVRAVDLALRRQGTAP